MQVRPLELFSIVDCGLSSSQWRLGKRHPGLQALFLSNCSSTISDQDVCRSEDHLIIVRLQPRVIALMSLFDGCIALALPWTHSTQARLLLPLPGRAGHRPEHVADRLLPFLSCQVTLLNHCDWGWNTLNAGTWQSWQALTWTVAQSEFTSLLLSRPTQDPLYFYL